MVLPCELIYDGECETDNTKETIKNAVLKYLNDTKKAIDDSICPGKNCRAENVKVECESRKRREEDIGHELTKRQTSYVQVTFEIATQFDLTNSTESLAYNELFPLLTAVGNRIKADVGEGKLDVAGFTIAKDGFQTSSVPNLKCPSALKKDGFKCSKNCY
ncbi:hypothetical protein DPMN_144685 [Dreissena polymorpha]|uniref:Uncharacterized protein n=1 Tax=Dreissena polymorpha TaxID=45954 RepID=A0A9D4F7A3_DREPO|nr:hypothetical protein DPMN_144685 [Dreissena polymorpha]